MLVLLPSCSKETPYSGADQKEGTLQLSALQLNVINSERVMRSADELSADDFIIEVRQGDEKGTIVKTYKYADMPEAINVRAGDYTVIAHYGENKAAEWESPYFYGSQKVTVQADAMAELGEMECKLANVKVTIVCTDRMKQHLGEDAMVHVRVGEKGTVMKFSPDEERAAYFAHVPDSRTLIVELNGTFDGNVMNARRIHTRNNVEAGVHYRITLDAAPDAGTPVGDIGLNFTINAEVNSLDLTRIVEYDPFDDGEDPGWRPDDGGEEPEQGEAPKIIPSADIDLDEVNDVFEGMECALTITSTASAGLQVFTVDIVSPTLTPDELERVGLSSHLDLINPDSLKEALTGLGFPVGDEVKGKKKVNFDISRFLDLLKVLPGEHEFRLEVGDSNGKTNASLKLRIL